MKTDNDIEKLLMSERKLSLNAYEKSSIKSTLLEHAKKTLKHETRAVSSLWASWMLRWSVSFASLLVVFVGTTYASQDSLPGEPLYTMKVHIVEEIIALTKTTPEERITYDIRLMENRLAEIKEIVRHDTDMAPEKLIILTDQIDKHASDVTTILEETDSDHIPQGEKIKVLAKLSGVTKAQAKIAKGAPQLTKVAETIKETQESTSDAISTTIEEFIAGESAEMVNKYLSDQIADVGEYVNASTTDESSRDTAERHLHDVDEAIIDNDATKAIISILEAQQTIAVDSYTREDSNIKESFDSLKTKEDKKD